MCNFFNMSLDNIDACENEKKPPRVCNIKYKYKKDDSSQEVDVTETISENMIFSQFSSILNLILSIK